MRRRGRSAVSVAMLLVVACTGGCSDDDDPDTDADGDADADSDGDTDGDSDADADADSDADDPAACTDDDDCDEPLGCYHGVCRHPCRLESCILAGGICHDGYCVDCLRDDHCGGSRFSCDDFSYECVEEPVDPSATRLGIFYNTWHCVVSADEVDPVYDISEILAGRQSWGPIGEFHWWDEPVAGHYCLARNDALLEQHALVLRDAGIDFIFVDVTNHAYVNWRSDRTGPMILEPMERLLAVWSTVEGAPRVVPWVPVPGADADPDEYTVDALLEMLGRYPGMHFEYLDRPLLLVTENDWHVPNEARLAALAATYTVRRMWAYVTDTASKWSFLERCEEDPTQPELCRQRAAELDGEPEQLPIGTAYSQTYMSLPSATPKHCGLTFRRQFETLLLNPEVPIATITGWNEWIAQRQPCDANPTCPCAVYPDGCFIDQYDIERNRDIEPANNEMGDYYYRLLVDCIALYRSGRMCGPQTADNLCCRECDVQ